jgi:hypothetical protein
MCLVTAERLLGSIAVFTFQEGKKRREELQFGGDGEEMWAAGVLGQFEAYITSIYKMKSDCLWHYVLCCDYMYFRLPFIK